MQSCSKAGFLALISWGRSAKLGAAEPEFGALWSVSKCLGFYINKVAAKWVILFNAALTV